MKISLIAALGDKGQIGLDGEIPFKTDLERFKYLTLGKTILMGRKTLESIGHALPGRFNIVITRKNNIDMDDVFVVNTLQQAVDLAIFLKTTELMICGGERLYKSFLPIADRMYLTTVKYSGVADTFFPEITGKWDLLYEEDKGKFKIFDRRIEK